jgi:uroporphyrinogen-III synthase
MIVALTRPRGVDSQLAQQLQASGCQVLDCAMTSIVDATPEELDHAVQLFEAADACVLVSPQAVKAALAASCSTLPGKLIAVMGPASKALLVQGGIAPQYILESATQDGLGLADELVARLHHAPDCAVPACVVIGRARSGRDDLARALSAQGLMVNFATLYHRNDLAWPDTLAQRLFAACDNDLRILFTTSSAPGEFAARLKAADPARTADALRRATALCTHPNVERAAADAGFVRIITQMGDESAWLASLQSAHV